MAVRPSRPKVQKTPSRRPPPKAVGNKAPPLPPNAKYIGRKRIHTTPPRAGGVPKNLPMPKNVSRVTGLRFLRTPIGAGNVQTDPRLALAMTAIKMGTDWAQKNIRQKTYGEQRNTKRPATKTPALSPQRRRSIAAQKAGPTPSRGRIPRS